ncbi:Protein tyrosine phosphatase domain-containing protein 1 [Bulinus truncatus]|nr:Protein tyrosine phosphatase domain-containing protein 1 [Bulinus truncatus]
MDPHPDERLHPGEEKLQWGEGIKIQNREKVPQARYTAFGEQARKIIPGESQCKMFCGGKACKYCTSANWTPNQVVVNGVYSEWVTHNLLAMARISNEQIQKFDIIKQFKEHQIKTVINLQQRGEHAYCGFGNDPSGFSYNPQTLMESDIFFYNFPMEDYSVASMPKLLDIVKVMQFSISMGKVAVHCHAGLGRTGLIIACYLIYNNRISAIKAVQYVRSRRVPNAHPVSFRAFLIRQRQLLHGYEARKLKHIPKVVYICCERLLELCGKGASLSTIRNTVIDPVPSDLESRLGNLTDGDLSFSEPSSLASSLNYGEDSSLVFHNHVSFPDASSTPDLLGGENGLTKDSVLNAQMKEEMTDNIYEEEKDESSIDEDLSSCDSLSGSITQSIYTVSKLCHCILQADANKDDGAINQLEESILRSQDISLIVDHRGSSQQAFTLLETSTRHFLMYIISVLEKLDPGDSGQHEQILELFLTLLCQRKLGVCHPTLPLVSSIDGITDSLRPDQAQSLFHVFQDLIHSQKQKNKK